MLIVQVTDGQLQVFFTVGLIKIKTRLCLLLIYQVICSVLGRVLSTWLPFAGGDEGIWFLWVNGIMLYSSLHFPITPRGSPSRITGKTHKLSLSPGVWDVLPCSFHLSHTSSVTLGRSSASRSLHFLVGETGTIRTLGS